MYFHVRIKTRFPNFRLKNGKKVSEWDFIAEGGVCTIDGREDCKHARAHAGRMAVETVWPDRMVASLYLDPRDPVEVWPAYRKAPSAA